MIMKGTEKERNKGRTGVRKGSSVREREGSRRKTRAGEATCMSPDLVISLNLDTRRADVVGVHGKARR